MAIIIDGKAVAQSVLAQVKADALEIQIRLGRAPKLAVVLVGENPASKVYVAAKTKKAHECMIETQDIKLPESISDSELQKTLADLSKESFIDGILLQLPLPKPLNEFGAVMSIAPEMDVDGLHPVNQGLLLRAADGFVPCTPRGVITLIEYARKMMGHNPDLSGLRATVVGRSILVGKPAALLLQDKNATVTMCHSHTQNLEVECANADILVAAVGRPEMIKRDYIKPGAIVIDVGINRLGDGRLVGDVDFNQALEVAGAVSPVPGGVGPMTIAMLLRNTVDSAHKKLNKGTGDNK